MKRFIALFATVLVAFVSHGQVQMFKGTLAEAMAKAKAEGKIVMIMGSTTWCGPCKRVIATVFPTKKAGDFMNDKVVTVKFDLDLGDPEKIAETYGIESYPTFVFVDEQGREVSRFLGASTEVDEFIGRVAAAIDPKNSYVGYTERMKSDPSVALDFARHLRSVRMEKKADKVLMELFNSRKVKQNFDEKSISFYPEFITSYTHPIFQYMLDKKNMKKIKRVMGEENYINFMKNQAIIFSKNDIVITRYNKIDPVKLDEFIAFLNKYPFLKSGVLDFVIKNKDILISKDTDAIVSKVIAKISDAEPMEVDLYVSMARVPNGRMEEFKKQLLQIYEVAVKKSPDERLRGAYQAGIDRLNFDPIKDAQERADKFAKDANYGNEYFQYHYNRGRRDEAMAVIMSAFERRDVKANFSAESLEIYKQLIETADNNILSYMVAPENSAKVIETMGKDEYNKYVNDLITTIMIKHAVARKFDKVELKRNIDILGKNQFTSKNKVYLFVKSNYNTIVAKDYAKLINSAINYIKGKDSTTVSAIISLIQSTDRKFMMSNPDLFVKLFTAASETETNSELKAQYEKYIERFKSL